MFQLNFLSGTILYELNIFLHVVSSQSVTSEILREDAQNRIPRNHPKVFCPKSVVQKFSYLKYLTKNWCDTLHWSHCGGGVEGVDPGECKGNDRRMKVVSRNNTTGEGGHNPQSVNIESVDLNIDLASQKG